MNTRMIVMASAFAALVGVAGAADCAAPCAAPCGTNACACACAPGARRPAPPLTLKVEDTTSDADVVTFKAKVLARIDEIVKAAKAAKTNESHRPVTIRLVVGDGRFGPPPHMGGHRGKGHRFGHRPGHRPGERPEPPDREPSDRMPPPEPPEEQ